MSRKMSKSLQLDRGTNNERNKKKNKLIKCIYILHPIIFKEESLIKIQFPSNFSNNFIVIVVTGNGK